MDPNDRRLCYCSKCGNVLPAIRLSRKESPIHGRAPETKAEENERLQGETRDWIRWLGNDLATALAKADEIRRNIRIEKAKISRLSRSQTRKVH